jgi:hypothetical protein
MNVRLLTSMHADDLVGHETKYQSAHPPPGKELLVGDT